MASFFYHHGGAFCSEFSLLMTFCKKYVIDQLLSIFRYVFYISASLSGFSSKPIQSELEVNYDSRFFNRSNESNPDAYTRLIFDVLQGKQGAVS